MEQHRVPAGSQNPADTRAHAVLGDTPVHPHTSHAWTKEGAGANSPQDWAPVETAPTARCWGCSRAIRSPNPAVQDPWASAQLQKWRMGALKPKRGARVPPSGRMAAQNVGGPLPANPSGPQPLSTKHPSPHTPGAPKPHIHRTTHTRAFWPSNDRGECSTEISFAKRVGLTLR